MEQFLPSGDSGKLPGWISLVPRQDGAIDFPWKLSILIYAGFIKRGGQCAGGRSVRSITESRQWCRKMGLCPLVPVPFAGAGHVRGLGAHDAVRVRLG